MLSTLVLASMLAAPPQNSLPPRHVGAWVVTETPARVGSVNRVVVSYRQPVGHTHTCNTCGTTWDHQANAGHNCPNCGRQQLIQDRSPRIVTVRHAQPLPQGQPTIQQSPVTAIQRSVNRATAGCPNGNCPYVR